MHCIGDQLQCREITLLALYCLASNGVFPLETAAWCWDTLAFISYLKHPKQTTSTYTFQIERKVYHWCYDSEFILRETVKDTLIILL